MKIIIRILKGKRLFKKVLFKVIRDFFYCFHTEWMWIPRITEKGKKKNSERGREHKPRNIYAVMFFRGNRWWIVIFVTFFDKYFIYSLLIFPGPCILALIWKQYYNELYHVCCIQPFKAKLLCVKCCLPLYLGFSGADEVPWLQNKHTVFMIHPLWGFSIRVVSGNLKPLLCLYPTWRNTCSRCQTDYFILYFQPSVNSWGTQCQFMVMMVLEFLDVTADPVVCNWQIKLNWSVVNLNRIWNFVPTCKFVWLIHI